MPIPVSADGHFLMALYWAIKKNVQRQNDAVVTALTGMLVAKSI
jgi:hypothetical protein